MSRPDRDEIDGTTGQLLVDGGRDIQFTYRCTVPNNVPARVEWHDEGGPILVDGAGLYRHHHAGGWCEYLYFFLTNQVDVLTDDSDSLTFVAGPLFVEASPRNDGYVQCREALRGLVVQFGRQRVKKAIASDLEESLPW